MTLNAKKRELGIDSLLPLEALKVRDFGSSRCPITAAMKIPEKSSTSYPLRSPPHSPPQELLCFYFGAFRRVKPVHEILLGEVLNSLSV